MISIKRFKQTFLPVVLLAAALAGCSDEDETIQNPSRGGFVEETHIVRDIDYIRNQFYYFVHPNPELDNVNPIYNLADILPDNSDPANRVVQVWQSVEDHEVPTTPGVIWANVFVDTLGDGADLVAGAGEIAAGRPLPPEFDRRRFRLLEPNVDFDYMLEWGEPDRLVGIVLKHPVEDVRCLAVRYTNRRGDTIGGSYKDYGIDDSEDEYVLKLVKSAYSRPDGPVGYTWHYMMRNFYNLGLKYIAPSFFDVVIRDNFSARADRTYPEGSDPDLPYLQIFGLDRYDPAGNRRPDGSIDIRPEIINLASGLLMMPSLMPFAPDTSLVNSWTDGQFSFIDALYSDQWQKSFRMYTDYLSALEHERDAYQYDIVIHVKQYVP